MQETNVKVIQLENAITVLQKSLSTQQMKLDDVENRKRRNNLILLGFSENSRESLEAAVVDDLFKKRLGVDVTSVQRIHRLGEKAEEKMRPVIMNFDCYKERQQVLKNFSKLKGSRLFLGEDFC